MYNQIYIGCSKDYWWSSLKEDVKHWVRSFIKYQAVKVIRHNKLNKGFYPNKTEKLFQLLHIDLVGPL